MRTLRPSIKKATSRQGRASARSIFRHFLSPASSFQLSSHTETPSENVTGSDVKKRLLFSSVSFTPNNKYHQKTAFNVTPLPQIIPATPAELSRASTPRNLRSKRLLRGCTSRRQYAKRRGGTRVLITTGLVFLYYCKSGSQVSKLRNANSLSPTSEHIGLLNTKNSPMIESPSTIYEAFQSNREEEPIIQTPLKRKAESDDVNPLAKRLRFLEQKGLNEWKQGISEASKHLQTAVPYATALKFNDLKNDGDIKELVPKPPSPEKSRHRSRPISGISVAVRRIAKKMTGLPGY